MNHLTTMSRDDAEARAKLIFFVHLGIYIGVNALLAYIDLTNNPERTWFYWPLAGWGAGLIAHAIGVFVTHKAADRVLERVERREHRREARRHAHN